MISFLCICKLQAQYYAVMYDHAVVQYQSQTCEFTIRISSVTITSERVLITRSIVQIILSR